MKFPLSPSCSVSRSACSACLFLLLFLAWILVFAQGASGQAAVLVPADEGFGDEAEDEEDADAPENPTAGIFPTPDRDVQKNLSDAEKLVQRERFAEAVLQLGRVLEQPQDFFVLDGEIPASPDTPAEGEPADGDAAKDAPKAPDFYVFRNVRSHAESLLRTAPRQMRQLYEVQFGVPARQQLDAALQSGNLAQAATVARLYFFTQAGADATFYLGMTALEQRRALPAIAMFEKLWQEPECRERFAPLLPVVLASAYFLDGQPERGRAALAEYARQKPNPWANLRLGGEPALDVLREAGTDMSTWLEARMVQSAGTLDATVDGWTMYLGNARRNGQVPNVAKPVLSPCWRLEMLDDPEGATLLELVLHERSEAESVAYSASSPLVLGKTVLARTCWGLTALDLDSGKRLWEVPTPGYAEVSEKVDGHENMRNALAGRLQLDGMFGSLASDGKRVFAVEDTLQLITGPTESFALQRLPGVQGQNAGGLGDLPAVASGAEPEGEGSDALCLPPNRLAAYDVRSGKLLWHIGGTPPKWVLPESQTTFLGAPLVVEKTLYVIGQRRGVAFLFAVEAETGTVLWKQMLCLCPSEVPGLALPAYSPSYVGGLVLCPTPNRALVAVDAATQSTLWGCVFSPTPYGGISYIEEDPFSDEGEIFFDSASSEEVPTSTAVMISEDGKLACFVEPYGFGLSCVDIATGQRKWRYLENVKKPDPKDCGCGPKVPTGDTLLYPVGIVDGRVIAVGKKSIFAVDLNTGEPLARDGFSRVRPAGVGFRSGRLFYLPMSDRTVRTYDLGTLKPAGSVVSLEHDTPGNLVPAGRYILSQRENYLTAYIQATSAGALVQERYQQNPESPEAITLEALTFWEKGDMARTVEILERGGKFTEKLLVLAMIDAIRLDYAHFGSRQGEVLEKILEPKRKIAFMQMMIDGLISSGNPQAAVEQCAAMIAYVDALPDAERVEYTLVEEGPDHFRSLDTWLAERLAGLADTQEAGDSVRALVAAQLEPLAGEGPTLDGFARFFARFSFSDALPGAEALFEKYLEEARCYAHLEMFLLRGVDVEMNEAPTDEQVAKIGKVALMFHRAALVQQKEPEPPARPKPELVEIPAEVPTETPAEPPAGPNPEGIETPDSGAGKGRCASLTAAYVQYLLRTAPDVACLEGKTPGVWVEALPESDPVRKLVLAVPRQRVWKTGKVEIRDTEMTNEERMVVSYGSHLGRVFGTRSVPFEGMTFRSEYTDGGTVVCLDDWGNRVWTFPWVGIESSTGVDFDREMTKFLFGSGIFLPTDKNLHVCWPFGTPVSVEQTQIRTTFGRQTGVVTSGSDSSSRRGWGMNPVLWSYHFPGKTVDLPAILMPVYRRIKAEEAEEENRRYRWYSSWNVTESTPTSRLFLQPGDGGLKAVEPVSGHCRWVCPYPGEVGSRNWLGYHNGVIFLAEVSSRYRFGPVELQQEENLFSVGGKKELVRMVRKARVNENAAEGEGAAEGETPEAAKTPEPLPLFRVFNTPVASMSMEEGAAVVVPEAGNAPGVQALLERWNKDVSTIGILRKIFLLNPETGETLGEKRVPFGTVMAHWGDSVLMVETGESFLGLIHIPTETLVWGMFCDVTNGTSPYLADALCLERRRGFLLKSDGTLDVLNLETGEIRAAERQLVDPALLADPKLSWRMYVYAASDGDYTLLIQHKPRDEDDEPVLPLPADVPADVPAELLEPGEGAGGDAGNAEGADAPEPQVGGENESQGGTSSVLERPPVETATPGEVPGPEPAAAETPADPETPATSEAPADTETPEAPADAETLPVQPGERDINSSYTQETVRVENCVVWRVDGSGTPRWAEPVRVKLSFFLPNVPRELPILCFSHFQEVKRDQSSAGQTTTFLEVYDARTGRPLYIAQFKDIQNILTFSGVPEENRLRIVFQNRPYLDFTFTDEPWDDAADPVRVKLDPKEDITARRNNLESVRRFRNGLQKQLDTDRKDFQNRQETDPMEIQIFNDKSREQEDQIKMYDEFIKKEEAEIKGLEEAAGIETPVRSKVIGVLP